MAGLFVTCAICGRKQTLGLLSAGAWDAVETEQGDVLHACPSCVETHRDWEQRLTAGAEGTAS
jgi:hypothetical protein